MKQKRWLAALLSAMALLGPGAVSKPVLAVQCAPSDTICQQLAHDQGQQASNADALATIQNQIKDVEQQIVALYAFLDKLNTQIKAQQQAIDATQAQVDDLDGKIRITEADITRQQAHLQVRETLFDQRVRSIDKHGSIDYLALALSATSFTQLIDRVVTAETIIRSDQQMVGELRLEKAQIQLLDDQLTQQRADEAGLLAQQQAQQAQLVGIQNQQQAALTLKQQLEAQFKAQADLLAQQRAAIDAKVAADQAAYAAEAASSGGGTGQFGWPLSPHLISQGFGCSPYPFELYWPSCASKHFHSGLDIAEPNGQPVMAADTGVATLNTMTCGGQLCGYGYYVVITHGNGYSTFYGHLSSFAVSSGQLVGRGQVIAYEGSTGNSTGPHLHFEIRYNGEYTNPCSYLGC